VRQLLEDLATDTGAKNPADLAVQLQVLIDGAIAMASFDHSREPAEEARKLALGARASGGLTARAAS
jgi:hypothetical protein